MEHYHYHVTYWDGNQRQIDSVPYTDRQFALGAIKLYWGKDERPKVRKILASHCLATTSSCLVCHNERDIPKIKQGFVPARIPEAQWNDH